MKKFKLYWKSGEEETIRGRDIFNALAMAGYTIRSLMDLDFYEDSNGNKYIWRDKNWVQI